MYTGISKVIRDKIWPYKSLIGAVYLIEQINIANLFGYDNITDLVSRKKTLRAYVGTTKKACGILWSRVNHIIRVISWWTDISL